VAQGCQTITAFVDVNAARIEAAGGVVVREHDGESEVLVVHRPRYDDWSLPKGKLEPGESHEVAALREVEEETGWRCELGAELPSVRYTDRKGRDKRVRYWCMTTREQGKWEPNDEVDDVCWIPVSRAATLLSYDADRRLVDEVVSKHAGGIQ
jgi:8-oxo-dGTP diphosphatase